MKLIGGDCLEVLKTLQSDSIDSIVTDPPYGISFMNKHWDYQIPSVEVWRECLRVLKPGGHALIACGTRTQHRMAVNIEDAGFEIRDVITWLYGSGFPKSLDVSKAIDKAAGAEREVVSTLPAGSGPLKRGHVGSTGGGMSIGTERSPELAITAPSTEAAKQWQGWGTALKPACEFWTLARKPLGESTVAKNVLKHGVGGINVDATRIYAAGDKGACSTDDTVNKHRLCQTCRKPRSQPSDAAVKKPAYRSDLLSNESERVHDGQQLPNSLDGCRPSLRLGDEHSHSSLKGGQASAQQQHDAPEPLCHCANTLDSPASLSTLAKDTALNIKAQGRFPSNLILDEEAGALLDAQSGVLKSGAMNGVYQNTMMKNNPGKRDGKSVHLMQQASIGGASRFFYCAKASKSERNAGLDSSDLIWEEDAWQKPDLKLALTAMLQLAKDTSEDTLMDECSWSTDLFGHSISEQYPTGMIFTIRTVLKLITELKTSNAYQGLTTNESIQDAIRTIEASGLSLVESAAFTNQLSLNTTSEKTASLLGVVRALLPVLLKIRGYAKSGNFHSTVKPIALMRYLCRLITPPGGIVLDPFMGSGSTGVAAKEEGFDFLGVELMPEYLEIAKKRVKG